MPKNPLKFGRRKSSGPAFEDIPEPTVPAQSSFRVIDRSEKINLNGPDRRSQDPLRQVNRPFNSPLVNLRGKSTDELSSGLNRGSGGTTASGSSGYYESSSASARHSSSSTLPSSVEAEKEPEEDELFPRKARTSPMYHTLASNANESPAPPPSFSTRAARALSFGQKSVKNGTSTTNGLPPLPNVAPRYSERSKSPHRERALTTSSYASTAKPEVNLNIGTSDFGADFGNDFSNIFEAPKNDRYDAPLPPTPPMAAFHRTESEPMFPPRTQSRNNFKADNIKVSREDSSSPYAWDHRNSREGLMSSNSPLGSPKLEDDAPSVPRHGAGIAPAFLGKSKSGYALVPERHSPTLPEPSSPYSQDSFLSDQIKEKDDGYRSKQGQLKGDRWAGSRGDLHDPLYSQSSTSLVSDSSKIVTRLPTGHPASSQATAGASRVGGISPGSSEESVGSLWGSESINTTPRAAKSELSRHMQDESLFDSSPLGPPSRAIRPQQHTRSESGTPKKMTKAQFERLQKGPGSSAEQSEEEEQLDEYDDEDDAERAKQMTRQRRKQDANMSVYRQQMKKSTGGGPGDLPSMVRPSLDRAAMSTPALPTQTLGGVQMSGIVGQPPADTFRGKQTEDDDEDVPLGILQAHGFPSSSRPPTRQGENNVDHQRRASGAGSVSGGGAGQGSLPPFARRLPQDPYFGSSIVNQTNRESFGMSGTPSMHGVPQAAPQQPSMGHPGGLVGVIAGEERAKAARRGSPNPATGAFNNPQMPLPSNMPQMAGMPGMNRTMTMGSMQLPQTYTPSGMGPNGMMMPQMPMTPGGMPMMPQMSMMQSPQQQQPNDQMQQFMQMQMQLMQNMINMQQAQMGQTPPPQPQQAPDYLGAGPNARRQSIASQAPSMRGPSANQGRSMTMMHPPTRWDLPQGGPRPNSAMPTTYAPSGMDMNHDGLGAGYSASIAPSERSNIGMPSRYRPVTMGNDGTGRTQTMTSANTLNVFGNQNAPANGIARPQSQHQNKSTIKLIDKPKGAPKVIIRPVAADEDEDEGWAEMRKKRDDKKKFRFGRKDKKEEPSLGDLYQGYN